MVVGIIDIGTNSVLLLIVQINADQSITTLHDECRIVRLSSGFDADAMERTIVALRDFKATCTKLNCDSIHAVGTAGFRMAKNADALIQRVSNELGINISIIDGKEEARLIYLSCQKDFGHLRNIAVLDIGGGSTEIVTAQESASLPFGVVTLTEQFIHSDPPKRTEIEQLRQFVSTCISSSVVSRPSSANGIRTTEYGRLIATAGTPTTLAAIHLGLKNYDSKLVHGLRLTVNDISILKNRLEALPLSERSRIPCLPEKRADVIVAGTNVLLIVMDYLNFDSILISDHGLRYGVLHEMIDKNKHPLQ